MDSNLRHQTGLKWFGIQFIIVSVLAVLFILVLRGSENGSKNQTNKKGQPDNNPRHKDTIPSSEALDGIVSDYLTKFNTSKPRFPTKEHLIGSLGAVPKTVFDNQIGGEKSQKDYSTPEPSAFEQSNTKIDPFNTAKKWAKWPAAFGFLVGINGALRSTEPSTLIEKIILCLFLGCSLLLIFGGTTFLLTYGLSKLGKR